MALFKHNQEALSDLLLKLECHSRVAVVQCTGTGKGKLASTLIKETFNDKRILLLAPTDAILTNYQKMLGVSSSNRVSMMTYAGLNAKKRDIILNIASGIDIVIIDEYHRCGAEKWGDAVKVLMQGVEAHGGKIVGFTATPRRFLDNNRDMTAELFNGVCVNGLDLTGAIKKGVLPVFTYIKARYGYSDIINDYKDKVRKGKVKGDIDTEHLASIADNDEYISNIVAAELSGIKGCQKWIVFCRNIEELRDIQPNIPKWFKCFNQSVNLFTLHSEKSAQVNERELVKFMEAHKGINVISAVNKLNEGVHVHGVTGVIMLRETMSPIIFLQQLGRALAAGSTERPYILDFVCNIDNISQKENQIAVELMTIAKSVNDYAERRAKKDARKGGKIIIKSYSETVDKILKDIANVVGTRWTPEEDEILKKYFEEEREEIQGRLMGRTWNAIYQRAKNLGLVQKNGWSRKEDNILRKHYAKEGAGVAPRLYRENGGIHRSATAIQVRASQLGLKKDRKKCWKPEEDRLLRIWFENATEEVDMFHIHKILDYRYTTTEIYDRLKYLGIPVKHRPIWKADEDALLKAAWGYMDKEELEQRLCRHTWLAITREASYLGLTKGDNMAKNEGVNVGDLWSDEDVLLLIEAYNEYGSECFTMFAPRSATAVQQKISVLRKDDRYKHLLKPSRRGKRIKNS